MGRAWDRYEDEAPHGLDVGLLALVLIGAAAAAGAAWYSYRQWEASQAGFSRRLLSQLDAARHQLRRQLAAGQDERADETRIRIAELQRAIMQAEGYI